MKTSDVRRVQLPSSPSPHYESFFLRANHPTRPLAFWIRHTLFRSAEGEDCGLWGMYFDGETGKITALHQRFPLSEVHLTGETRRFGTAEISPTRAEGLVRGPSGELRWDLALKGRGEPVLTFPPHLYSAPFPKAKLLVCDPQVEFTGRLTLPSGPVDIDGWTGSDNHNWGPKHTDRYAWGQVCGFDGEADLFLECATARIRLGPVWSPWFTILVLREGTREYRWTGLLQGVKNRGVYGRYFWALEGRSADGHIRVTFSAPEERFAALTYRNPIGGTKTCLNTKLAACSLSFTRPDGSVRQAHTTSRGAFEILTDATDHGLPVLV